MHAGGAVPGKGGEPQQRHERVDVQHAGLQHSFHLHGSRREGQPRAAQPLPTGAPLPPQVISYHLHAFVLTLQLLTYRELVGIQAQQMRRLHHGLPVVHP